MTETAFLRPDRTTFQRIFVDEFLRLTKDLEDRVYFCFSGFYPHDVLLGNELCPGLKMEIFGVFVGDARKKERADHIKMMPVLPSLHLVEAALKIHAADAADVARRMVEVCTAATES